MILGAGIFVMGTLFGWVCTKNDNEVNLMMENLILQHQLDESRCKDDDENK